MKELNLTNLTNTEKINKNYIALGHWIKNEKIDHIDYHWKNKKKLNKDYKYLNNLSEKLIHYFVKKLNTIHKEKKSRKYWRIILSSWLYVYISSMYDRWESINCLLKNKNNFQCDYFYSETIFKNFGTTDYIEKVTTNDLWNHSNFIRIIKYKQIKKLNFKNINKSCFVKINSTKVKKNPYIDFLDSILSNVSIFMNSTIIENFYISKN